METDIIQFLMFRIRILTLSALFVKSESPWRHQLSAGVQDLENKTLVIIIINYYYYYYYFHALIKAWPLEASSHGNY